MRGKGGLASLPKEVRVAIQGTSERDPNPPGPQNYPLTRNYCENNSLRIIFRNF